MDLDKSRAQIKHRWFTIHILRLPSVRNKWRLIMSLIYVPLVHQAKKKGGDYGIIFPDFPGCIFCGKKLDAALENARNGSFLD